MNKWKDLDKYIKANFIDLSKKHILKCKSMKTLDAEPMVMLDACESIMASRDIDIALDIESETFQEMLFRFIDRTGLSDSDIYNASNVDKRLFSKIRSDKNYHPSKNTVIQLAFGLKLDIDDALDLLDNAGYSLSFSVKFDIVVRYFLENEIYDLMELNQALFDHDLPLLFK